MIAMAGAAGAEEWREYFPENPDPLMGWYEGRWVTGEEVDPEIAAFVIPMGRERYQIKMQTKLFHRPPPTLILDVRSDDGKIEFEERPYRAVVDGETFTGDRARGEARFEMKKVEHLSPTLGMEPPEGAVVLFDGSGFDAWQPAEGWELLGNDTAMVTPDGDYLVSKETFTDLKLHIEFRTPYMPGSRGQSRGNSGLFIHDVYEVQILDTFGLEGFYNECGALYKLSAPRVNACAPPLQWQTYDIEYTAPRWSGGGELLANGRMTVHHNGVLIQNDVELKYITAWTEEERMSDPPREPGAIKLQAHDNYVQFRNIWVVPK